MMAADLTTTPVNTPRQPTKYFPKSLESIVIRNLSEMLTAVNLRARYDEEVIQQIFVYFSRLPACIAESLLLKNHLPRTDVDAFYVAVILHPQTTNLDLSSVSAPVEDDEYHDFDLSLLLRSSKSKMKNLISFSLPKYIRLRLYDALNLLKCVPNLDRLQVIRPKSVHPMFYIYLSTSSSHRVTRLSLNHCNLRNSDLLTLCGERSVLRDSLRLLQVTGNEHLAYNACKSAFFRLSKLEIYECDYSLPAMLTEFHETDANREMKRYALTTINTYLSPEPELTHFSLPILSITCPKVTHLKVNCGSKTHCCQLGSTASFLHIRGFSNLTSLEISFCRNATNVITVTEHLFVSLMRSLSGQLEDLKFNGSFFDGSFNGSEPIRWKCLSELRITNVRSSESFWLVFLGDCPRLEQLSLSDTPSLSDSCVYLLRRMPSIKKIILRHPLALSPEGLHRLQTSEVGKNLFIHKLTYRS